MSLDVLKQGRGGERGIRTPGTCKGTSDFESGALNRALPSLRIAAVADHSSDSTDCRAFVQWQRGRIHATLEQACLPPGIPRYWTTSKTSPQRKASQRPESPPLPKQTPPKGQTPQPASPTGSPPTTPQRCTTYNAATTPAISSAPPPAPPSPGPNP